MRILTGIQPSGKLHWGNYFGAMKSMFDLQAKGEDMFMFIANFHAMTTVRDGAALREATLLRALQGREDESRALHEKLRAFFAANGVADGVPAWEDLPSAPEDWSAVLLERAGFH